jgi:hypothetical protein
MSKIFSSNDFVQTPSPNLGSCSKTGSWDDKSMINECKKCVSDTDFYNEKRFYCDGQCMSKYDLNQFCPESALVAKTLGQCESPCYQEAAPIVGGGCSDDFDCQTGQKCVIRQIKYQGGIENRGFCEDSTQFSSLIQAPFPVPDSSDWTLEAKNTLLSNYIFPSIKSYKFKNNTDNLAKCVLADFISKFEDYKAFYSNDKINVNSEVLHSIYSCVRKVNILPEPDNTDWNDNNKAELVNFIAFYSYFGSSRGVYDPTVIKNCVLPELQSSYNYKKFYSRLSYQDTEIYNKIDSLLQKCKTQQGLRDTSSTDNTRNQTVITIFTILAIIILLISIFLISYNF